MTTTSDYKMLGLITQTNWQIMYRMTAEWQMNVPLSRHADNAYTSGSDNGFGGRQPPVNGQKRAESAACAGQCIHECCLLLIGKQMSPRLKN